MDVFDLSPATLAELPKEVPAGPVDIPFHTPYALVDEKAPQIVEAENQKLDDLMDKFTKGFDPGSFGNVIMSSLPKLANNLFPGTYAHLLLILFETFNVIQSLQLGMENWLLHRFDTPNIYPGEGSFSDESFFAAEIEMLRKLLEPIREGTKRSIFWLNTRRADPSRTCEQLEASIRVIETFKNDICAALSPSHENRTTYSTLPVSVERTAMFSMKHLRLDSCKATLHWDSFNGSELEFTSFFRFYKAHVSKNEPAKARASGWLPPTSPGTPRLSAQEASEGDLASWISHGIDNEVIDLLLKTAMWLSIARGLAAVHLFCDVARLFVLNMPSKKPTIEYRCFLQYLTRLRASAEGAPSCTSPLVPRDNKVFPSRNIDYFEDVWRTSHELSAGLYDNISLFVKNNVPNFQLSKAPPRRRSGHADMHIITQVPLRGNLDGIPQSPEESPSQKGPADDYDLPSLSPDKSAMSRSRTV